MQLNNKKNNAFAMAAASLMSASNISTATASDWSHEINTFIYTESDDRVTDKSIRYSNKGSLKDGDTLVNLNFGVDVLTGASPTGALPSDGTTTIVTSPSGNTSTTNSSSKIDKASFNDKRYSFDMGLDQALNDTGTRANVGLSYSTENDYNHVGVTTGISKELNKKNTILSIGAGYSDDTIEPIGNTPVPLSTRGTATTNSREKKTSVDFLVGLTQILSKNTIAQFNYGLSQQSGYLNDPYKLVSRIDDQGKISNNVHESRPDSRLGHNIYGAIKHSFASNDVATGTLRLHTDDWGINSFTTELKYRAISGKKSIEPFVRFYHQSAADFYTPQLLDSQPLPEHASADYRISEFSSYTLGATYRLKTKKDQEWNVTGEFYKQSPGSIGFEDDDEDEGESSGKTANNPGYNSFVLSLGLKF